MWFIEDGCAIRWRKRHARDGPKAWAQHDGRRGRGGRSLLWWQQPHTLRALVQNASYLRALEKRVALPSNGGGAVVPSPSAVGDTRGGAASSRMSARPYEHSTRERVKRTRKDPSARHSATATRRDGLWASTGVAVSVRGAGSVSLQHTLIACACFSLQDETGRWRPCQPCRQRRQWR